MLQLTDFIIDCPDPKELAEFYSELTGRPYKVDVPDQWTSIRFGDIDLAFYRVDSFQPPTWPSDEHPKQFHLDFEVDEFEPEQRRIVELGATHQRDFIYDTGYGWQVYTDPVGHPFCLCRNKGANWKDGRLIRPAA